MDRCAEMDEVIAYIHQHIHEPLPLSQLADLAAYSPYHFTRMFKKKTGLSPHYYISSLRLQKAKELLIRTNLPVRDIGLEIGQQSLGTFTTRFTQRIGVTPSQFRKSAVQAKHDIQSLQKLKDWNTARPPSHPSIRIEGAVQADIPLDGVVFIGLFAKPIPEGLPLYGTLLSSLGSFCFTDVKPGTYYLMATSVSWGRQEKEILLPTTTLRTRSKKPIIVKPFSPVPYQTVTLHPPQLDDPPILVSLPLLMRHFLTRTLQYHNP